MKYWPSTLPRVSDFEEQPGRCPLATGVRVAMAPDAGAMPPRIAQAVADLGLEARPSDDAGIGCPCRLGRSTPDTDRDAAPARVEGRYELSIAPGEVVISADDESGWFYGLQTLRQLMIGHADDGGPACGLIRDTPRFPWRGSMIDSARHLQPVDWILRHLDRMAALKLNRFHWHLADDEGWRAEILRYPELTDDAAWRGVGKHRYGGFYTQDDMRRVVAYARERFITVIPEIEMPGHCNAALIAFPHLSCDGEPLTQADEGWNAYTRLAGRRAFCAANEQVYTFIQHVLRELGDVFDPPYLHVGGDETPRRHWEKCPRCTSLLKEIGGSSSADLRVHFLDRVAAFCRDELGRPTIAWTDGVSAGLPRDQIVNAWFSGESAKAARLGFDTINSNHEWTYLDYPDSIDNGRGKPDWMIVLPLEKIYHFDPLPDGLEAEYADRVLGSEAALWTEHTPGPDAMEKQLMPRLAAFAEVLWSPRLGRSYDDFLARLGVLRASLAVRTGSQAALPRTPPPVATAAR